MRYLIIFLLFIQFKSNAQIVIYTYCFDQEENCEQVGNYYEPNLTIDFDSNPNNIWQIGTPQKTSFNIAHSIPKAILTDTINYYPIQDTSSFSIEYITEYASSSIHWTNFNIRFNYQVDTDSLLDQGELKFSPDNGATWIDLISDPFYSNYLDWTAAGENAPPVLTGNSSGWQLAYLDMSQIGPQLDIQPGTKIIWKFTFISDAIQTNKDGLMFDNIAIVITPPIGIEQKEQQKKNRNLLSVTDLLGRKVEKSEEITNQTLIYIYDDGSTEKIFKTN
jgi:hypothetical protein